MNIYAGGFFGIRREFRRWRRTDMDRPVERAVLAAGQDQGAASQNDGSAKPPSPDRAEAVHVPGCGTAVDRLRAGLRALDA